MTRCENCDTLLDNEGNIRLEKDIVGCNFCYSDKKKSIILCENCKGEEYDSEECRKLRKDVNVELIKAGDII